MADPPHVYRLPQRSERASAETYAAFLRALLTGSAGRERMQRALRQMAERLAARHPEIRALPDLPSRLEAARRVFFADADSTPVERTEEGYRVSLSTCPLAAAALEFTDLCCLARDVLTALVGAEVGQTEWIVRGDPRCTFEVRPPLPSRRARPAQAAQGGIRDARARPHDRSGADH